MKKNFPLFPVSPFSGDDHTPPYKGNTGVGVYEMCLMAAMHALITRGETQPAQVIDLADNFAKAFVNKILNNK